MKLQIIHMHKQTKSLILQDQKILKPDIGLRLRVIIYTFQVLAFRAGPHHNNNNNNCRW